ncbi:homocysteine biosynthesis protein [Cyanobium sp. NIES-981]|uniref:homocysteine biosynthesis protein n=1 Tax=Cyanobium sp. NIES-981 TaxID=1851505 RepID=UPI0007DDCDD9|nr:homocysteine biosynthesis protein [Cyanobium sp. NIES-981]SBO42949.1 conserved protein of unknown function [Cyanobium sp. NIES-981]
MNAGERTAAEGAAGQRSEAGLRHRQEQGELRVRSAEAFRRLVREHDLATAYERTDVVVAADAGFTDQASLHLSLGPTDPPIRLQRIEMAGVQGLASGGSGELVLPIGGGMGDPERSSGAAVLDRLLRGQAVPLAAAGEATRQHPRRDLNTELTLERIAAGRLLLHRAIGENGVVAVSSLPGICHSPIGPLLGPLTTGLYSCGGAGSIGMTSPGLRALGPGSPVLVAGAIGWVMGSGSGHQPEPRRQASGHARTPGAVAAVAVDLHGLDPRWLRPCHFEGHGSGLLVAIAAPVPLLSLSTARWAATGPEALQTPVLDLAIPRRVKPALGQVSYAELQQGSFAIQGHRLRCAPAHSPRLAASITERLITLLQSGAFPLRLPALPLGSRAGLVPLDP